MYRPGRTAMRAVLPMRILFLLFLALALAGCGQPFDSGASNRDLVPPKWTVGDQWRFVDGQGHWENWTVVGIERIGPVEAYKVAIQYVPAQEFGVDSATAWIETRSLGLLKHVDSDGFRASWTPAIYQLFPFEDRVYNVTMTIGGGQERPLRMSYTAGQWEFVNTPAGRFEARRVEMIDTYTDQAHFVMWYDPHVGNFVKRQDDDATYELASWTHA